MASFQKPASYNVAAAQDLPASILSYNPPRPPAANIRNVVVQNNTGTQASAGRLEFQLPGGMLQYLKSGSAYIRGAVTVTGGGANNWSFAGPAISASALINRLTVSVGGVVVERIDRYDLIHQALLIHTGGSYYSNDAPVLERPAAVAHNGTIQFCLPIMSQLLNAGQHFPLWAASAGSVVIACDLNTAAEAIYEATSASITNYSLAGCQLVYDALEMSPEFINGMKAQMAQGKAYSIPFLSFRTTSVTDAASLSINMALNCSSLKGVMFINRAKANVAAQGVYDGNDVTAVKLYVDGSLINSLQQATKPDQYAELQKFLSKLNDTSVAAGLALTQTTYDSTNFVGAVNTRLYDDAGFAFQGKACSTLTLEVTHTALENALFHTVACYDTVLVIDPSGVPAVLQ